MFKKSEESEWTRFSRALAGAKEQTREAEDVAEAEDELLDDDQTIVDPPAVAQTPPSPPPPPPAARPPASEESAGRARAPRPQAPTVTPEPAPLPQQVSPPVLPELPSAPRMAGDETESVIGEGTTVEGTFRSENSVHIFGTVQGELQSKKHVLVEQRARVDAKISAESVTIMGQVNGEVACPGRVEITPTGRVTGEISAGSLVMQEGAFFEGHLRMLSRADGADNGGEPEA